MANSKQFLGILAIVLGILVLALPDLLRWAVGIYLIVQGFTLLGGKIF